MMNENDLLQSYRDQLTKLAFLDEKVQQGIAARGWDAIDLRADLESIGELAKSISQLTTELTDRVATIRGRYDSPWWIETIKHDN